MVAELSQTIMPGGSTRGSARKRAGATQNAGAVRTIAATKKSAATKRSAATKITATKAVRKRLGARGAPGGQLGAVSGRPASGRSTTAAGRRRPAKTAVTSTTEQRPRVSHAEIAASLVRELARCDPDGILLMAADAEQAAMLAADRLLDPAVIWERQLGAFYEVEGVRRLLRSDGDPVSRQAVSKRKLLALVTGSGRTVYPAFHFRGRSPIPGLDEVLVALPDALLSRWTVAAWLTSPETYLDGERPIDVLTKDGATGRSLVVATAPPRKVSL